MKISAAINFCIQYQKANSKINTIKNYEFILGKFVDAFTGREQEVVFIPRKLCNRLVNYVRDRNIPNNQRIFPITYAGARKVVVKVGEMLGIKLRPHDLRRHAATYASRAGLPIEIISKIILRHSALSTIQQYLGKVSDIEAIRWIKNLHG